MDRRRARRISVRIPRYRCYLSILGRHSRFGEVRVARRQIGAYDVPKGYMLVGTLRRTLVVPTAIRGALGGRNECMGLLVTLVSGVRRCGKSSVVRAMVAPPNNAKPHYLRLVRRDDTAPPLSRPEGIDSSRLGSTQYLAYKEDRIFEVLPEALSVIHRRDRFGSVVIEADDDPTVRCAYPYDHRVFVMPLPASCNEVFRDPQRAAVELQRVLDDTVAFASEVFGLQADSRQMDGDPSEERRRMTVKDMRGFLYSPLGDELATRIQLRRPYHGLVESDVIIVNPGAARRTAESDSCLRRIKQMLERLRAISGRQGELLLCNLDHREDASDRKLQSVLRPMCRGGC